jgi:hypothetical protein
MATVRHCRSCGQTIFWLQNEKTGKEAPIDTAPTPTGNILIFTFSGLYRVLSESERKEYTMLWTNHFATCPQAQRWHKEAT